MSNDESPDLANNSSRNFFWASCKYVIPDKMYFLQLRTTHSNEDRLHSRHLCDFKSNLTACLPTRNIVRFLAVCDFKGKPKDNLKGPTITYTVMQWHIIVFRSFQVGNPFGPD